jgi:hypothetical protein
MRRLIIAAAVAAFASAGAFAQNNADRSDRNAPANAPVTAPNAQDQGSQALPRLDYDENRINTPANPAVKTTEGNNPGAPAAGANSFTEDQARARIESRGYTSVSDLMKDNDGIWRGTAMKDGRRARVSLDFQGNVVASN